MTGRHDSSSPHRGRSFRATIALAAVILAGAVVTGCGGSTGSTAGIEPGSYSGSTSQGLPITFTVTSNRVESVDFSWTAKCADGHSHTNEIELGSGTIHAGAFSVGGTLDTGALAQVQGTVQGNTASGQLSRSGPSAFGTDCVAAGVSWQVRATGS